MDALVGGLRHAWSVVTKMNFSELFCGFHNMEPWRYKKLVSVMWPEIIQLGETRPKFWYGRKTARICLISKYVYLTFPLDAVYKRYHS